MSYCLKPDDSRRPRLLLCLSAPTLVGSFTTMGVSHGRRVRLSLLAARHNHNSRRLLSVGGPVIDCLATSAADLCARNNSRRRWSTEMSPLAEFPPPLIAVRCITVLIHT